MKKRIFSILTALALCLTLLPCAAWAADETTYDLWQITDGENAGLYYGDANDRDKGKKVPQNTGRPDVESQRDNYFLPDGTYKLAEDIAVGNAIALGVLGDNGSWTGSEVTLDLNGYVLQMTGSGSSVIEVVQGSKLTLTDNASDRVHTGDSTLPNGGVITGNCYGVSVTGSGSFTMNGGSIVNCNNSGVRVSGTFTMNGGSIENCKADYGGGVSVSGGSFTMKKGSITGCTANGDGDGVFVVNGGTFQMYGGTITGNNTKAALYLDPDPTANSEATNSLGTAAMEARGGTVSGGVHNNSRTNGKGTFGSTISNPSEDGNATQFSGEVTNNKGCIISGGTFQDDVISKGEITGGEYKGVVYNENGTISGGTYNGTVLNGDGTISNGTFNGEVNNSNRITGGMFNDKVHNLAFIIDGTFESEVMNSGEITGGIFYGTVTGSGTIEDSAKVPVTFDYNYEGSTPDTQKILRGQKATRPADPTRDGYIFGGWYNGDTEYTFASPVTENITLTARWLKDISELEIILTIDGAEKTWESATVPYDGKEHTLEVIIKDGDKTLTEGTDYTVTGSTTETNAGNFDLSIQGIGNYTGDKTGGWGISLAPVTVKADDITVYVGDPMPTLTCTATGLVEGEELGDAVTLTCNASDTNTAGTYTITPSGTAVVGNYTVTYESGTLTVKARPSESSAPTYSIAAPKADNGTVKVSPKNAARTTTVTVTATPDAGYQLASLTVYDEKGNEIELKDLGNGKYSFKMPGGEVEIEAEFAPIQTVSKSETEISFADVSENDYFYDAVRWAVENGITTGVSADSFGPHNSCTRSQLAVFLYRYVQAQSGGFTGHWAMQIPFEDLQDWNYEAVAWCYMNGIVSGYGNGLFGAEDEITREQVVTILYRFAVAMGMDVSVGEDTNILSYNDAFDVSEYAVEAFQWAVGAGIVQGDGSDLMPGAGCTRAQIVTMLYRLLGE